LIGVLRCFVTAALAALGAWFVTRSSFLPYCLSIAVILSELLALWRGRHKPTVGEVQTGVLLWLVRVPLVAACAWAVSMAAYGQMEVGDSPTWKHALVIGFFAAAGRHLGAAAFQALQSHETRQ
jgi:hypothetical protein